MTTTTARATSPELDAQREMSDLLPPPPHVLDKLLPLDTTERGPQPPLSTVTAPSVARKQHEHEQQLLRAMAASTRTDAPVVATDNDMSEQDSSDKSALLHYEGYLRKRYSTSVYMGSWRYCIVQGSRLRWYMTDALAHQDSQLRGEVWVRAIEPWTGHGSVNTYPHAFAIRTVSNRVLLCSAKSRSDKDAWLACLQRGIQQQQRSLSALKRSPSSLVATAGADDRASHALHETTRRIVPEDMLRHTGSSDNMLLLPPPPPVSLDSVASSASSSALSLTESACTRCAVRFGTVLARRVVCSSCAKAFCSRHCAHPVTLAHLDLRTARRCCYACARRQEFIAYLARLTRFLETVSTTFETFDAVVQRSLVAAASAPSTEAADLLDRTLRKLRRGPMSLVKTIKILYQTRRKPLLFRAACERLPFYVEHCIDRVENVWYQLLHLFQCCDADATTDSASLQLVDLRRYIRAICRRSPRIALQTIWHVQASAEDANGLHPHSLLSLLGFLYPRRPDGTTSTHDDDDDAAAPSGAMTWHELLLAQCPDHQRHAILDALDVVYRQTEALIAREPQTMITRWLNATTVTEFEASARELARSDIELCEFQSSIFYDSLRFHESQPPLQLKDAACRANDVAPALEALVFDQVRFVESLAAMSERLRHVQPVEQRTSHLARELTALNDALERSALYPLCTASDELFRVLRIPPTEGKVFSTKMRAPTLIFLETVPVHAAPGDDARLRPFISSSSSRSLSCVEPPAPVSLAILGDTTSRGSLESSAESSTDAILCGGSSTTSTATAQAHASRGSYPLSLYDSEQECDPDHDDDSGATDKRSALGNMLNRHRSAAPSAVDADAGRGLSHKRHSVDNLVYDCNVYGESWAARRARIQRESPFGHVPGWELFSVIVKTNDDLRQEVFTMQLLETFRAIFERERVGLWLRTYRIVATGANIGLLETITDACSLDHLKKTFGSGDLAAYFTSTYGAPESPTYAAARANFIASMAAYSVVSYVLLVKDRHNGNLLLSTDGHIIHIDFGFILGIAPGGRFSIEDAPFKLTVEMVAIMGGLDSPGFATYRRLLCDGFVALQKYQSDIAALLQTTGQHSPFPCFENAKLAKVLADLRDRLCVGLSREQVARRVDVLIRKSYNVWGTRQYDAFQLRSNNIHP